MISLRRKMDWERFLSSSPSFACLLHRLLASLIYIILFISFLPTHLPTILTDLVCCSTLIFLGANYPSFHIVFLLFEKSHYALQVHHSPSAPPLSFKLFHVAPSNSSSHAQAIKLT